MIFLRLGMAVVGTICMLAGLAIAQPPEEQRRRGGQERRRPSFERFAKRFDANNDGKITSEEFTGRPRMFERFDSDGDGVITKSDFANLKPRRGRRGGRGGGQGGMFGRFPNSKPMPGQIAPDFILQTPDGKEVSLGKLLYTKPVVLEFGSFT